MSARRARNALASATFVAAAFVCADATAQAAPPDWSGRYTVVTFASDKIGTSIAARQPEPDFSGQYTFTTSCAGTCVATASDGPPRRATPPPSRSRPATRGTASSGCSTTTGCGSASAATTSPPASTPRPARWCSTRPRRTDRCTGRGVPKSSKGSARGPSSCRSRRIRRNPRRLGDGARALAAAFGQARRKNVRLAGRSARRRTK